MAHLKPKQLLLIGLIVVIFCVLAAMTPLGARTAMIIRFQIAELSADNSNDEYGMDLGRFYVRNRKTIHCLKQMLFRTSCKRIPIQTVCESTLEIPSYYLGERCFGADVFYEYQFGPVRYHLVFKDSDYRVWRAYIDSVYYMSILIYVNSDWGERSFAKNQNSFNDISNNSSFECVQ